MTTPWQADSDHSSGDGPYHILLSLSMMDVAYPGAFFLRGWYTPMQDTTLHIPTAVGLSFPWYAEPP